MSKTSSNLDKRVQDLVNLIFDRKMMDNVMSEMEYDVKKNPLGNLTKKQIKNGYLFIPHPHNTNTTHFYIFIYVLFSSLISLLSYEVLKQLEEAIKQNKSGSTLSDLSSRFYTLIPHAFGMI